MSFSLGVNQGQPARAFGVSNQAQPAANIGKTLPYTAKLASATTDQLDLTNAQALGTIDQIQTVYIDNSGNASPISLTLNSGQTITCPANSQGYFPLFSVNPPVIDFASNGGVNVTVFFGNMPMPVGNWSAISQVSSPVTLTDRSTTSPNPAASTTLMVANANRSYLLIKAPETADLWVNPFGGTASVGGSGCFKILQGGAYESPTRAWNGQINYFTTATGAVISAAEG